VNIVIQCDSLSFREFFSLKLFLFVVFRGQLGPSPISGIDNSSIHDFIMKKNVSERVPATPVDVVGHKRPHTKDESHYQHRCKNGYKNNAGSAEPPTMLETMSCSHTPEYHARLLPILSDLSHTDGNEMGKNNAKETCIVKDIFSHNLMLVCVCKV